MILNCIIIDDEPLAANLLASYVERTPFLSLVGSYNGAVEAMRTIRERNIDLCFLDIQMPELSGMELAKIIPSQTKIIFTTAFNKFAVDGYKVNALDYLLKPISYEQFLSSAVKASKVLSERSPERAAERSFYVKSDYKLVQVNYDDILYVEGDKDYVKIYLEGNREPLQSLLNLKKVEEHLPKPEFMRTHRSYIVHMPKAGVVERLHFLIGDARIPISESYKSEVYRYLDMRSLT